MKKKLLALGLIAAMTLAMTACGDKDNGESSEMPNPVHECSQEDMIQVTGLDIAAPDGAESVVYSYIDGTEESSEIAQVVFTLDGTEFCYRAQSTSETSMEVDMEAGDIGKALDEVIEKGAKVSGMYETWSASGNNLISDRDAIVALNEGKSGFVAWLDVVPGVMYSLSVNDGATQDLLIDTAQKIFVPMQGEA